MQNDLDELLKEAPTLTFDVPVQTKEEVVVKAQSTNSADEEKTATNNLLANLTEEEKKLVDDFAMQIDLTNSQAILQYGVGSQKKIADFSETALDRVKTKDLGEIGQMLTEVVVELKSFEDAEEEKGFLGFFKKTGNKITNLKAKYDKAQDNITKVCQALELHQRTLLKDIAMLDKMYDLNVNYFKELSMYLLAGKQRLERAIHTELPALTAHAAQTNLPEDTQKAKDFSQMCNRFEKKLHDLELTRMISIQMAPQIRLIQNNDTTMSDKIQSTLVNTIPLWKSQMVIAIGLSHSLEAAKASREVSDMTNALLRKNAETLKVATIETARESERGIVDMETIQATNQSLISTLDEVMKIQEEGREKRKKAEQELRQIETQMREKLLEMSR
ncbi:MAG: toxic anion resistance protein [Lachnospiraceae bacterium]|jgi:uncharacterized protein YaaN involved in tellurite resistance|nr:toxic anion resistance protein [Lachnospiraceae bacterium]